MGLQTQGGVFHSFILQQRACLAYRKGNAGEKRGIFLIASPSPCFLPYVTVLGLLLFSIYRFFVCVREKEREKSECEERDKGGVTERSYKKIWGRREVGATLFLYLYFILPGGGF